MTDLALSVINKAMKKILTLPKTWTDEQLIAHRALNSEELQHRLELNRIASAANGDGARRNRRAEHNRRLARRKVGRHED
jgi:hypothetical protein